MNTGKALAALALSMGIAAFASAEARKDHIFERGDHESLARSGFEHGDHDGVAGGASTVSAPEIGAGAAVAALLLVGGGILLIRSRRRA